MQFVITQSVIIDAITQSVIIDAITQSVIIRALTIIIRLIIVSTKCNVINVKILLFWP